jgi:fructoselysine 3-epimerase
MANSAGVRIAGMNFHYCRYPFEFFLDSMVALGVEAIELWAAAPHCYLEDLSSAAVRRMRRGIGSRGLTLVCFTPEQCVYPVNLAAKEAAFRKRSIAYFLHNLEAAVELGSPLLLVTPGCGYFSEPRADAWRRSRDSLATLARHAKRLGAILALEPLSPTSSNLINGLSQLKRMVAEVESPHLKAMLDTVQMAIIGEEIEAYFDELGGDLVHIHLVDGAPQNHLAWGDGILPLERYLGTLSRNGYVGHATLEICDRRYFHAPQEADKQSLIVIQKASRKLQES